MIRKYVDRTAATKAVIQLLDKRAELETDSCETHCKTSPGKWQKPLCRSGFLDYIRVPMKLTNAARTKAHVDGGDGRWKREVILGHLPPPTAVLNSLRSKVERRPVLRHAVDVGWRRYEECRLVFVNRSGLAAPDRSAPSD